MKKSIGIVIEDEIHRLLKARAAERGMRLQDVTAEIFQSGLNMSPPDKDSLGPRRRRLMPLLVEMESRQPAVLDFFERELRRVLKGLR